MKTLCQIKAGSHLYGLNTSESDVDIRGVFVNTDPSKILGLKRQEVLKHEGEDTLIFELCHFLKGLQKTSTQFIEILFAREFEINTPEFEEIQKHKLQLINSKKLFSSLKGYIHNERRLANGERTGRLGSKRKNQIEAYGFSPKNFSHLLRLAHCGSTFFKTSYYPLNLQESDPQVHSLIYSIKTDPFSYNKEQLNQIADEFVENLNKNFDERKDDFLFDEELANQICLKLYRPYVCK